jgi:hypothetical protein
MEEYLFGWFSDDTDFTQFGHRLYNLFEIDQIIANAGLIIKKQPVQMTS